MPEQQNIEYKQSWHDDYLKWVCGFANAIGGMIYIGIDDNGNVAHLAAYAKLMEELKGEHNSRPRNPKIAKACFMAGYIDTWGRGTLKIYNSCKEHGLPEPAIFEKDGGFMVALYKAAQVTDEGGAIGGQDGLVEDLSKLRDELGSIETLTNQSVEENKALLILTFESFAVYLQNNFGITLEKLQDRFGKASGRLQEGFRKASGKTLPNWVFILELISIYPNINAEEISKIIGTSDRTIYKYFSELQEKGMIERIGGRKEGFWQIIKLP